MRILLLKIMSSSPNTGGEKVSDKTVCPHHYCLESFSVKVQMKLSDRNLPGPITCIAEFLPTNMNLYFRPHQYMQYQKLRSAMLSQQRFDTMLRQRPADDPADNPLAWWKYAISCVTTRPNSRPWGDVFQIAKSRTRYIELVKNKVLRSSEGNGFHGGLDDTENLELLKLEELLPIEALLSFHLLAVREVYETQKRRGTEAEETVKQGRQSFTSTDRTQPKARFGRFRRALSGVASKNKSGEELLDDAEADFLPSRSLLLPVQPSDSITRSSLRQAISSRLVGKVWHNTFHLSDAKFTLHMLDPIENLPTLKVDLRTSGKVQSYGRAKRELSFDVMQFEVVDCRHETMATAPSQFFANGKILSVGEAPRSVLFSPKASKQMPRAAGLQPRSSTFLPSASSETFYEVFESNGSSQSQDHLAIPTPSDLPQGVVCRITSSKDLGSLKLRVSAHPATLVWNKSSVDAVSDFFASSSARLQTELTRQLQNVATPLARKAQLALLSPDAIVIDVNMAAPKLWVPVSSKSSDGAVFLDAGRFKFECTKEEQGIDTHWDAMARDIQVMFVRLRKQMSRVKSNSDGREFSITGIPNSEELPIVRPFHVHLNDSMLEHTPANQAATHAAVVDEDLIGTGPLRKTTISVSPIRLNLVDAEVLARAIGKWYADGLVRVRGRVSAEENKTRMTASSPSSSSNNEPHKKHTEDTAAVQLDHSVAVPHLVKVTIEKIEVAVEGHSKSGANTSDDQSVVSFASQDTFTGGSTPRKRTYIVEVFEIGVVRTKNSNQARTKFTVLDASITRVKDDASPFPTFRPQESQYHILVRGDLRKTGVPINQDDGVMFQSVPESPMYTQSEGVSNASPLGRLQLSPGNYSASPTQPTLPPPANSSILNATLFHDSAQHLDEVEIDIDSVLVRVTPTSLKDCAKGLRRVLELAQLATREMERKVHEEGRNARRMSHQGTSSVVFTPLHAVIPHHDFPIC